MIGRRIVTRRGVPIMVVGDFLVSDGFGGQNEYMVRGMARAGAEVHPWPLVFSPRGLSEEFLELLARSRPHLHGQVIANGHKHSLLRCLTGPELFIRQTWATSRFPAPWLRRLNRCRAVIASTTFVADVLRASGLEVPVEVVPDGVDPEIHHYETRPDRETFTTLIVGRNIDRKHHPQAVASWQKAFEDDPNARLIIKTAWAATDPWRPPTNDPRIQFVDAHDLRRGLAPWYRTADVLLAMGSEGTGLPMLEAMATGLPVVALASEGQGDVCRSAPDAVLPVQPSQWMRWTNPDCGLQGIPDVTEAAARLRWVAEHRAEAAELGRRASEWVHRHRNVWDYGPDVLCVVSAHSRHRLRHSTLTAH